MSEKKGTEEFPLQESSSQAESYSANKSGTAETYDMKDFCPGIRIEAKDFDGKWYPAKVSDVDWTENEILVHFENWNTKFDEWIPMDSSRLRPIQKPALQQKDAVQFSKGEEVMAVWSANQKYPGVIQAVLANDRYDVLFSDGFLKRLKGHKISKLPGGSVKAQVKNFTDIGTKEERRERKRKINVAELFHINKRPRKKGLVHSKSQDIKTYPVSKSRSKGSLVKKLLTPEENKEETSCDTPEVKPTDDKLINPSASVSNKALVDSIPAAFEVKYLNGQTETWSKQLYQRSEGRTAGKLDIVILNPQGRKFRSRNEIMKYCEENGIVYSHEAFDFSAKGRPKSKPVLQTPPVKTEARVEDKDKLSLKKGNRKSHDLPISSQSFEVMPSFQAEVLPPENVVPNKVFIGDYEVVIENGKFICPVKICGKHFRRENLLHMHMKHYHPEFSKYLDYTPSVTDLAYARTVGTLDAVEVSSPAPRKLATVEKPEKSSIKAENIRKPTEVPSETVKETKKAKTTDSRTESRSFTPKTSTDTPITSTSVSDELVEENTQKSKLTLSSQPTGRNENETPPETKVNPVDAASTEQTPDAKTVVATHPVIKSSRRYRLHNRKKTSRFQSSFSEHLRKKRFISQDRSRSHNKIGRQQQTPNSKQQLQQTQQIPQTIVSSYSPLEETNSNAFSTAYSMARYPKPQSNMTNEISGKTNLLTSCKTLSPVASNKNEQSKHGIDNVIGAADESGGKSEETRERKSYEYQKNKENKKSNPSVCNRRSFLAGLLSARKRKGKAIRKRLKKKKVNRIKNTNGDLKSGRSEYEEKPDEVREESTSVIDAEEGSPVLHDVERYKSQSKELPSAIGSIKLKIKRLDVENMTLCDSNLQKSECFNPTELEEPFRMTSKPDANEGLGFDTESSSEASSKTGAAEPSECVEHSPNTNDQEEVKGESRPKDLFKSFVLLENVCRKENYLKYLSASSKRNDENQGNLEVSERSSREGKNSKRPRNSKDRKQVSMKRVRFENKVLEKWISVDEGEEYNASPSAERGTGREDRKKKPRKYQFEYLNEKEGNLQSDDEKSFTSTNMLSLDPAEGTEDSKSPLALENDKIEKLRRNEIINCLCGITEEDGLMIQCDLCLCWQHGHCAGILRELDVPDKYTCAICKNPYRARSSMKYLHDQDWLKEGALPSLSFRSKREDIINQRKTMLKRSHDLSGSITLLAQVIHSLRIKVNIAEKKDHPKLWLWAKKWTEKKPNRLKEESDVKEERTEEQSATPGIEIKVEGTQDEKFLPKVPEPEAPIDSAECRLNLLDHLIHYQTLVDARLSCIESLVAELESMQDDAVNDETPDRYPRTKATVQMILRDLNTMKKVAMI